MQETNITMKMKRVALILISVTVTMAKQMLEYICDRIKTWPLLGIASNSQLKLALLEELLIIYSMILVHYYLDSY